MYKDKKECIRQSAIGFQTNFQSNKYDYNNLLNIQNDFYKLGKRYGLLKEFRENAII